MKKKNIVVVSHTVYNQQGFVERGYHLEVDDTYVNDLTKEDLKDIRDAVESAYYEWPKHETESQVDEGTIVDDVPVEEDKEVKIEGE